MPERHERMLVAFATRERCQNHGCPDQARYKAVYQFQHDSDRQPTRRIKLLCERHAEGHAQAWGLTRPEPRPKAQDIGEASSIPEPPHQSAEKAMQADEWPPQARIYRPIWGGGGLRPPGAGKWRDLLRRGY